MKHTIGKDALWKGVIEELAIDFIDFFFPEIMEEIDFSRKFVFLDKELSKLFPAAPVKNRHGDKLMQVFLKNGESKYFLIHVEVQGWDDHEFDWRMFQCMYRLIEKYRVDITALVIYTSGNTKVQFNSYHRRFLGTELIYKFNTFKLTDYSPEQLQKWNNPFALALEAAWYDLQAGKWGDAEKLKMKLTLAKRLFKRGYKKKEVESLLNFIKYYVNFEGEENFNKFEEVLIKNDYPMGVKEAILKEVEKGAYAKGIEKGIEKGEIAGATKQAKVSIKNMLSKGIDLAAISEFLGLPIEQVEALIEEMKEEGVLG